jgi:YfiH family protein
LNDPERSDPLRAEALAAPGVAHAFFTRRGGVSTGVYASLNGGVGSRDAPDAVRENRARMAAALGVPADHLLVPFQAHTNVALTVDAPWAERPRCDGLATATPGIALGVTGADCGVILFADAEVRVIGAAHAGWKGALDGVIEATLDAMIALGARRSSIVAALGPTIGRASYQGGPEFVARFRDADARSASYFSADEASDRSHFNLPGFIRMRARAAGVAHFQDLALDTYADPERFFSYRRATHRGEPDYGRLVAAITLV